jgi:hypothetical protein
MRKSVWIGWILLVAVACRSHRSTPDVSGIRINLELQRFEIPFFALDTSHLNRSLQQLAERYPGFTQDFLFNILGTTPDSAFKDVPRFIRTYQSLAQASAKKYADFSPVENSLKRGLQFLHYYFPSYKLPTRLITFIGPINSYGNIITKDALAVGLQLYMGKEYPLYQDEQGQALYPAFVSRRFEPQYITVNCIRNIVDDIYPDQSSGKPLVEQMIESGKRQYLLEKLLPELPDSIRTGYTAQQLAFCRHNEQQVWSFFVQNDLLFSNDPNTVRDYLTDAPNTAALGESSPGNIGQFVGRQIVDKWMDAHEKTSLDTLMKMPAAKLFEEAKYKPR